MGYEEDCEKIRKMSLPITHYIYCPEHHAHWPDLGGVYGALALGETGEEERRDLIEEYLAEGKRVVACRQEYTDIQPIYQAMRRGEKP